jgi:outer membrane protein assembly factor BamC
MKPSLFYHPTLTLLILTQLAGCSYVKSLFPDKEKDYQYTAEIPALSLPDDLKKPPSAALAGSASAENKPTAPDSGIAPNENPAAETDANSTTENQAPAEPVIETIEKQEKIAVELIKYDDGENRLRLSVEKPRAWRLINKALSRRSIEVTNRNQDDGFFVVQYDPAEEKVEDGSLWDEAVFMLRGFQYNEQEFVLKLEAYEHSTEVAILDKDQQPLPEDESGGLKLLSLLQNTINLDLAKKLSD